MAHKNAVQMKDSYDLYSAYSYCLVVKKFKMYKSTYFSATFIFDDLLHPNNFLIYQSSNNISTVRVNIRFNIRSNIRLNM